MRGFRSLFLAAFGIALTGATHHAAAASPADLCVIGTHATTTVSSSKALQSALSQASPGTTIVVRGGTYSGDFTLSKSGNASKPITVRAAGKATFQNSVFTLKGSYTVLTGMTFDNGMVTVQGDYNRVTRNVFKNGRPGGNTSKLHAAAHTEGQAKYNRFDHNEVVNWQRRALRNTALKSGTKGNRFDHNYLHNMKGTWGNSGEAFQVGAGSNDPQCNPETIIEYNLVDGHALEAEIVSLKANGNVVRGNTFLNAPKGTLQSRTGSKNKFINNTMINIKEMGIYGDNNEIIGNKFVNSNLKVRSGDTIAPELLIKNRDGSYKYQGSHPAARNTLVAGNEFSGGNIGLGKKGTGKITYPRTFPAEKTLLASNKGARVVNEGAVKGTNTNYRYAANIDKPVRMYSSDVGPEAADPICESRAPELVASPPTNLKILMAQP